MSASNYNPEFRMAADCFNLAGETGEDPERLEREKREAAQKSHDAEEFTRKHQLALAGCPGLVGADAPAGPGLKGRVVLDPRFTAQALPWLKRRYRVSAAAEVSNGGDNLVIDIAARAVSVTTNGKKVRVSFDRPVQFEFNLQA